MSLTIAQWQATGLLPTSGMQAWHQYQEGDSENGICLDYSGNARDLGAASNEPVLTADVLYGHHGWYFNGSRTPLTFTGAVTAKHVFILASFEDAAFTINRGLLSGVTSGDILVSEVSGTQWTDLGLVGDFIYRKSDTLFPNASLEAPMNGAFALMDVRLASGVALDGIQIGQQRDYDGVAHGGAAARRHKGYFIEQIIYNRVLSAAEIKRVHLYFNLKYSQYKVGLPLYFPSDEFMNFKRRRFYAEPPMYSKITDSYEYEDGGKTFNEVADSAPRRWEYDYVLVNTTSPTDPGEVNIFNEFFNEIRMARSFNFTDKYGTVWTDVRIEDYDRTHEAHKPWRQTVKFKLIKYPG